jgi:very-short-patch-repair endonuclease
VIVESVLDAGGGIQSLPERDFDDIRRSAGLPPPTRQLRVKGPDGRFHLDVAWEDSGIAVEVHGVSHLEAEKWSADLARANEIVIGGRRLLAFSSFSIRHEQAAVADQLLRLFRSAGWTEADAA